MDSNQYNPSGGQGLMAFVHRYREYESQKEETHSFIKDLLLYAEGTESHFIKENQRLRQQLNDARLDIEGYSKSRKNLEQLVGDLETRLGFVPDRNPYVVVLIDGDGLLFKEKFVKKGLEGGKKAAEELHKAIAEKFNYSKETTVEILVKVIANVPELGKAMKHSGCLDTETVLYDFISGFNQAKALFDFVNVGHGMERADAKILECTEFHLRNFNCKQVLLGVSHDAGYASPLGDIIHNEGTKQRITILEGVPTAEDIVATGISITSFKHIFRSEKLRVKSPQVKSPPANTMSASRVPFNGASYAAITSQAKPASPPPKIALPLALKPATPAGPSKRAPTPAAAWNPGPHGLDPPIPVNAAVLERMKRRKEQEKLCNNHFLRGPCTKGDECSFEHNYNPTKDEKNVIALFARLNPCTRGQECDVDTCIYGHHCPSVVNGWCTHPHCKFRVDEHPPGTKFKYQRLADL
ncbi:hypothetical protein F5Y05DRAFT_380217 [Hypoxylon sp. FL0543]|nr:hypothetical protein F5Y05DRAFT_380217 [Hypoxylon sp. FL0543]